MARHANFTAKLVEGLCADEAGVIARIGDEAATRGAKLAMKLKLEILLYRIKPTRTRLRTINRVARQIGFGVTMSGSELGREIAAFNAALKRHSTKGYAAEGFAFASSFVVFCESPTRVPLDEEMRKEINKIPTLKDAFQRGAHTPSVADLHDHLMYIMEDGRAPDYKTCERWAERLGIKPAPRPRSKS